MTTACGALLLAAGEGRAWPWGCRERCGAGGRTGPGHDPGKVLLDLACLVAVGRHFLANIAVLRGPLTGGGHRRPVGDGPAVVDLGGSLVVAHLEKAAAPTFEQTFGFHPLLAFADHDGPG